MVWVIGASASGQGGAIDIEGADEHRHFEVHHYHHLQLCGKSVGTVHSRVSALFSINPNTWSNLVVNKLSAVKIPPFGPRLYLKIRFFKYLNLFIICFSMNHTEREGKSLLLHNLLVVYCIANIDIGIKWGT